MLVEKLREVVSALNVVLEDCQKADAGNKAAARRVRVALQEAKKSLHDVRQLSFDTVDGSDTQTEG